MTRAIVWGLSRLLGIQEAEPVAHAELEHAHWDPTRRVWFTHQDQLEQPVARAA